MATNNYLPSCKLKTNYYTNCDENADMAVIMVFFNPTNSIRIIQNMLYVKHHLERANIPTYIGEMAFLDFPHILPKSPNIYQARSNSYMFYKENLIRIVETKIPPKYTKLCIMDADIIFDDKNWYSIVSKSLDANDICQPFTRANLLNPDYTIDTTQTKTNCIKQIKDPNSIINWCFNHVGYIWAFRRDWFKCNYTEDRVVIGGGDTFLFYNLCTGINSVLQHDMSLIYSSICKQKKFRSITMCNLTINHLFHGLQTERQYVSRFIKLNELFLKHNIKSLTDIIVRRTDSVLEWRNDVKQIMNNYMQQYFTGRCDDAINGKCIENKSYKFFPTIYSEPNFKDMAVVLCFFNPSNYIRMVQNIFTVKNFMERSKIPFYIAELAFFDKPFLFKKESNIFQYRSNSYLFYKENLNTVVEKELPDMYKKVLFLDADISFDTANWYSMISNKLNNVDITIPFCKANWLNLNYKVEATKSNSLDSTSVDFNWDKEHVGFCVAVNRNVFHTIKIYNTFMIGGDTQLVLYLKHKGDIPLQIIKNTRQIINYLPNYPINKITYTYDSCNLNIFHLNHGTHQNRNYWDIIKQLLEFFNKKDIKCFDDFLYIREDGIFEIKENLRDETNKFMKNYFDYRLEDCTGETYMSKTNLTQSDKQKKCFEDADSLYEDSLYESINSVHEIKTNINNTRINNTHINKNYNNTQNNKSFFNMKYT